MTPWPIEQIPPTRWARTVDGASIAYQDFGDGPTALVFVHAWFSHLEIMWEWPGFERFMRRLAKNLRVVHFDKRGVGMSDRLGSAPSLDVQMDDIRAVLDAAEVERAVICGEGHIAPALACTFAATHPERALGLWLDGPVHTAKDDDYHWGETEEEWDQWIATIGAHWGSETNAREFAVDCFGADDKDVPYDDPSFRRWLTRLARSAATPTSIVQLSLLWRETDVRGILPTICVPTGIAAGRFLSDDERGLADYLVARIPGSRLVEIPKDHPYFGSPSPYVSSLEHFIDSILDEEAELDRKLATVMFTDVVGSTDRSAALGDASWNALLEQHNAAVRAMLARYRGAEVKTMGDGFLATFDGPARAVKCAQGICEAVKPLGLEVRAGCHTGEIELMGADVGGIAVHIGARVGALAGPSEVLVSSTVKDLVAGSGLVFEDRGEHTLKGVPEPWHLYAVGAS
jgi:class 3 adenylate cyclase/pimeloyl-ACP methyl ester carboxylesterase